MLSAEFVEYFVSIAATYSEHAANTVSVSGLTWVGGGAPTGLGMSCARSWRSHAADSSFSSSALARFSRYSSRSPRRRRTLRILTSRTAVPSFGAGSEHGLSADAARGARWRV